MGQGAFLIAAMAVVYVGPFLVGALVQLAFGRTSLASPIAVLVGALVAVAISLIWAAPFALTASPTMNIVLSAIIFGSASEVGALLVRALGGLRMRSRLASESSPEASA